MTLGLENTDLVVSLSCRSYGVNNPTSGVDGLHSSQHSRTPLLSEVQLSLKKLHWYTARGRELGQEVRPSDRATEVKELALSAVDNDVTGNTVPL